MSQTLSNLVQRTVTRLSMVPGVAVQIYAEDRIAEMIYHKFVMVRDELWWDDMMDYAVLTQDADGVPEENVVRVMPTVPAGDEIVINAFSDIQYAWSPNRRDPLKSSSRRENPSGYAVPGTTLFTAPHSDKVIRFYRITAGQQMMVRYKRFYSQFNPDDIVPMDEQLMILGAAYDFLEDDASNPGQTEKFMNFFNNRLGQLKAKENQGEIMLSPGFAPEHNGGWQVLT